MPIPMARMRSSIPRPLNLPRARRIWTPEEDEAVRTLPVAEAVRVLGRTAESIYNRRASLPKKERGPRAPMPSGWKHRKMDPLALERCLIAARLTVQGYGVTAIGRFLGVTSSAVAKSLKALVARIEEKRWKNKCQA